MVKISAVNKMHLDHDYFTTQDCKVLQSKVQTNPRYKNFTQIYYTVGDVEQFWVANNLYGKQSSNSGQQSPQLDKENVFKNLETFTVFDGYKNVSAAQVEDTFNYIFHKFKKGIFIKIRDGQLDAFIPFSKAFYINEWSHLIKIDPKFESLESFFKVHHDLSNRLNKKNYRFDVHKINLDPSFWYANNCILRYENPINEGENNYPQIKSMFLELCASRRVPDIEFFVNRRDFPILTRNATEPYFNIYGDDVPLKSFKFERYLPILSMCSSDRFADVAIPTHDDWSRIKSDEGIFFPPKCKNYSFNFNHVWESKKNLAVFRGSNTGCGYTVENNTRLKLAKLGQQNPQLLDVGITNWNLRIRKNKGSPYLQIPNVGGLTLVGRLSPEEQSNYKFLIHVDGHVSAFRLSLEMKMGCCILMVESAEKWKLWFSDLLEPYVHFVPVKADLTDLLDQLKWCLKNDEKCKKMAQNNLRFYEKFLTRKGVLDNLQHTLFTLRDAMYGAKSNLVTIDPILFQSEMEHQTLLDDQKRDQFKLTGLFPNNVGRNYGSLKGLEQFIMQSIEPDNQITLFGVEIETIFKSKTTKVTLYQIGAEYIVGKRTIDRMKKVEFIHEAFIGKYVINNLLKFCPNFSFILAYRDEPYIQFEQNWNDRTTKETTVLREYVEGPTLQNFLRTCSIKSYLEIILSLNCALIIAQTQCGFVHHDLKPWNIMVNILPEPIIIEYLLRNKNGRDLVYKIKTRYVPIIIDYGKSHVVYKNVHYGITEPFTVDKNIDFVTLVISTINELVQRFDQKENSNVELGDLLFVTNFLTVTKVENVHQLKTFLFKTKKFGNLNMARDIHIDQKNSSSLEEEFFKYVTPLIRKYKIGFGKDNLTVQSWSSNTRQIIDMGFGLELEDKVNSYLEVVRRIYKNPMPQATNRFTTILIAQKLFDGLVIPKMEFMEFATRENLNSEKVQNVLKEFEKMENFIMDFYSTLLKKKIKEPFNVVDQPSIDIVSDFDLKPSRSLFLDESSRLEVNQKMKNLPLIFPDYMHYRSLIMEVLRNQGPFKIDDEDKKFYMDNFKLVFDDEFLSKVVNIETIRFFFGGAKK